MKLYLLMAVLAALVVTVPWGTQNLYLQHGMCEVQVWLWLTFGAAIGWLALQSLKDVALGAPSPPLYLLAVGASASAASFLLPPTLGSVPALGALYWAVGGVFADARTRLVARKAQEAWRTGADWTLANDPPPL